MLRFDAQLSVSWSSPPEPADGVTLRDVFPGPAGELRSLVRRGRGLGTLCGIVGSMMVAEAIKLITGIGEPLLGMLVVEALTMRVPEVPLRAASRGHAAPARLGAAREPNAPPSPIKFDPLRDARGRFVDAREPDKYAADRVPGAVSLPLSELLQLERDEAALRGRVQCLVGEDAGTKDSPLNLY